MAPPAETETSSTVLTQSNDDGWTVQEGRKRRVSASPSLTGGKVMATAAADEATMKASSPVLPTDPTGIWIQTKLQARTASRAGCSNIFRRN